MTSTRRGRLTARLYKLEAEAPPAVGTTLPAGFAAWLGTLDIDALVRLKDLRASAGRGEDVRADFRCFLAEHPPVR